MNGKKHYRAAEWLLEHADQLGTMEALAKAQVHATLAVAAANMPRAATINITNPPPRRD